MNIIELRDKLNDIVDAGYGNVEVIGPHGGIEHEYKWRHLEDAKICDRDGHGGAGLNLIFE